MHDPTQAPGGLDGTAAAARPQTLSDFLDEQSFGDWLRAVRRGLLEPRGSGGHAYAMQQLQRLWSPFCGLITPLALIAVILLSPEQSVPAVGSFQIAVEAQRAPDILDDEPKPDHAPPGEVPPVDDPALRPDFGNAAVMASADTLSQAVEAAASTAALVRSPIVMKGVAAVQASNDRILSKGIIGRSGAGSVFGATNQFGGDMVGSMYDFKRDGAGNPRSVNYWEDLRSVVAGNLSAKAFKPFYRVPRQVYLSHIFVPFIRAEAAPEAFGVGGLMEARGWIAHYSGEIQPVRAGRYRFAGVFDDTIIVLIDGRVVLEFTWANQAVISGWKPTEFVGAHKTYTGRQALVYSDWLDFTSDRPRKIDILVGERPGGMVGGVLLIQDKSVVYKTEADGRPILPIFAVSLLSPQERQRLADFKGMAFDTRIPLMKLSGSKSDYTLTQTEDIKVFLNE